MDIIGVGANAVASLWAQIGIIGFMFVLFLVFIVGVFWLANKITRSDSMRDNANSKNTEAQLKIMENMRLDNARLNEAVIKKMDIDSIHLEKHAENAEKLNAVLGQILKSQEDTRLATKTQSAAIAENRSESRLEFNALLERMLASEAIQLEMSRVVAEISKRVSANDDIEYKNAVESWMSSVDKALSEIQESIRTLVESEKKKERDIYVQKEIDDLLSGRS